jgi:hypothetical protein
MLVRSKQSESSVRWPRRGREGHNEVRASAPVDNDPEVAERRHTGPSEDQALYSCECGYVFRALVTTSVGCPHCARKQAW